MRTKVDSSRRGFLKLAGVTIVSGAGLTTQARAMVATSLPRDGIPAASLGDDRILVEFDSQMRSRLWHLPRAADGPKVALTQWATTESLTLADGTRIDQFALRDQTKQDVDGPLGRGTRLRIIGLADSQVEKTTAIELLESYPGLALYRVSYRNLSPHPISIRSWTNSELHLPLADARAAVSEPSDPPFWSCCGSTHPDRRDWVQPVKPGFEQQNFM